MKTVLVASSKGGVGKTTTTTQRAAQAALAGKRTVLVDAEQCASREPAQAALSASHIGTGRELFASFRAAVGRADTGASIFSALPSMEPNA